MQYKSTFYSLIILLIASIILPAGAAHQVHKYAHGPVIQSGSPGTWDAAGVTSPKVLFHNGDYHLWYTGTNYLGQKAIGYATSKDGIEWVKNANPVLVAGGDGEWDAGLVGGAEVIFHNGKFHMWYNGARGMPEDDGLMVQISYATSSNGIDWKKSEDNPGVFDVYASGMRKPMVYAPSVIYDKGVFRIWYTSMSKDEVVINTATSNDGADWQRALENPVIQAGAWHSDFVAQPSVVRDESGYIMYLTSMLNDNSEVIYARSKDGLSWTKANPGRVIATGSDFNRKESGVANGSVLRHNGIYKFWYGAKINGEWQICYAEDFEAVPHVDKVGCEKTFHSIIENPDDRFLHMKAIVHNPNGNKFDVTGCVKRLDGSQAGSFSLTQENDTLWAGQWEIPMNEPILEQTYDLIATASCGETGTQNCSGDWQLARFTTVGPIQVTEQYYFVETRKNTRQLRLILRNFAQDGTAGKVTARLTALKPEMVLDIQGKQVFGDIGPGQSKESSTITYFEMDETYQDNTDRIPVMVHIEYDGFAMMSFPLNLETETALENLEHVTPTRFELTQNYPNPFNPATTINFSLPSAQNVVLKIYNNLGEIVATLVNEPLSYGSYSYLWHAGNIPSGIYYYQLLAGPYSQVRKMVLVK